MKVDSLGHLLTHKPRFLITRDLICMIPFLLNQLFFFFYFSMTLTVSIILHEFQVLSPVGNVAAASSWADAAPPVTSLFLSPTRS